MSRLSRDILANVSNILAFYVHLDDLRFVLSHIRLHLGIPPLVVGVHVLGITMSHSLLPALTGLHEMCSESCTSGVGPVCSLTFWVLL